MIKINSVEKEGNKIKVLIEKKICSIGRGYYNEIRYFNSEKEFKNWVKYKGIKWNSSIR